MKNTFQASIAHLLEQACPSIQYRVRREILGEPLDSSEMRRLQKKILQDDLVRKVFSWEQPDGWLGRDFHGEHSLETGIRILREKGVEARHPRILRALAALAKYPDRLTRGFGFPGAALDEAHLGGAQMARAAVFACAGSEEPAFVKEQIQIALQGFISVAELHTLEGLYRPYRGKLVWSRPVDWPGLYHLRLLAWTYSWRNIQMLKMVARAVQRLGELSPIPGIYLLRGSQVIAPALFCMDDFNADLDSLTGAGWMAWFHRMELLARLGVVSRAPAIKRQADQLRIMLASGNGLFQKRVEHRSFRKWGAYTGMALEKDWKAAHRRVNDLTFRSLLILAGSNSTK